MSNQNGDSKHAYELPDEERAASASPTENELEKETPTAPVLDYSGAEKEHDPYAAIRISNFRFYVVSYSVAVIGGQVQMAAIDWELYARTKSPLMLGIMGFVQFLPVFLLALPAGQVADIFDRKRVLLATQLLLSFWGIAMAGNSYYLGGAGHAHAFAGVALAILFLNGVTLTFARPSRAAILPHLVPQHLFSNAVTWNSTLFEVASMSGPALGGFIIHFGASWAYLLNAFLLLICFAITFPLPNVRAEKRQAVSFGSLIAGVKFVFQARLLVATMTMDLFAVLLGGATYLLPIFAQDILQVGPTGYGWMRAAPAIGALMMAMTLAHLPPIKHAGRNLLLAVTGFGIATIVFGLSKNYWLSLAMLFLTGAFDNISVVVRHTLVQLLTPDEMRGRVSAVNQVFIGSSNELGGFESGVTARLLGPVLSVVLGGIGTVLVVLGVAGYWPELRRLGKLQDVTPEGAYPDAKTG